MSSVPKYLEVEAFGLRVSTMELAFMTHLSQTTVYRYLRQYGFYDGNDRAAEIYLSERGITDRESMERRINKIKLEHPEYYSKVRTGVPKIRFESDIRPITKKKKEKRLTYTQELIALGYEPWPSDFELEARGER